MSDKAKEFFTRLAALLKEAGAYADIERAVIGDDHYEVDYLGDSNIRWRRIVRESWQTIPPTEERKA